jgi:large subunit ribosomal protein L15
MPEPEPIIIRYSIAGRKQEINVDTLSAHFEDGDTINLAALKAKGLVPASTKQIKVLARNSAVLNKAFHIEAQAASAAAKCAVEAAGGSITIVRPE